MALTAWAGKKTGGASKKDLVAAAKAATKAALEATSRANGNLGANAASADLQEKAAWAHERASDANRAAGASRWEHAMKHDSRAALHRQDASSVREYLRDEKGQFASK